MSVITHAHSQKHTHMVRVVQEDYLKIDARKANEQHTLAVYPKYK